MTTEITALLREKAITASDGAVTVENIKAWKNVKKTFKLCDNPPVNIMVNGSPTINNFPIQTLIHEFEKIVKKDNIADITNEFLDYIGKTVPKTNVKNFIDLKLKDFELKYSIINKQNYKLIISKKDEFNIEIPPYINEKFDEKFEKMIHFNLPNSEKKELITTLKHIFCHYLISESTGIIITGINKNDYFPSTISFNIILNNNGKIEIMNKKSEINCNKTKLDVYGETDVVDAYLTGIDENFEIVLFDMIKNIFNPTDIELKILVQEINRLKMINKKELLKKMQYLPEEDLFELMKILIKSTELKRKLLSKIDSVGGDIHIEKITKHNGIERNNKIYKTIKTIEE